AAVFKRLERRNDTFRPGRRRGGTTRAARKDASHGTAEPAFAQPVRQAEEGTSMLWSGGVLRHGFLPGVVAPSCNREASRLFSAAIRPISNFPESRTR